MTSRANDRECSRRTLRAHDGFTLLELLITLVILGLVTSLAVSGFRRFREATALSRATTAARSELALARMLAIRERAVVRVRVTDAGDIRLEHGDTGEVLSRLDLSRGSLRVDSARIRPAWFRFNSRGHAAPGSLYLYRGDRGVRLVSNFLGRTRVERFSLDDG